ncbi:unnamed protein product [Ectocarpus sp. 8 AP-2014]
MAPVGQSQDPHAVLTDTDPVAAASDPAPRLCAPDTIPTPVSGAGRVSAVGDRTHASRAAVMGGQHTPRSRVRRAPARALDNGWPANGEELAATQAGAANTARQQEEVVHLAGAHMISAPQSAARAAQSTARDYGRASGTSRPSAKAAPAAPATLPSRGDVLAASLARDRGEASGGDHVGIGGIPATTSPARAAETGRGGSSEHAVPSAMAEPVPSTAQLSCWRDACSFQDPPITGSNGNGGATSSAGEFGGARSEGKPQQPAAAAAAAVTVAAGLAGVAVASAGSAASSSLTGAGGIAGAGGKKGRKKTKPVSAAVLEVRNRRREKIQEKAAQRRPPAVAQPVAEPSESLPGNTSTAELGGGGNTEPAAVAKKKLHNPGRTRDLGVAALHKALCGGGGKRATQGQKSSSNNAAGRNNRGARGWVLQQQMRQQERCIRYWNKHQQQRQEPGEGLVKGAGSPEPHAWQEEGGSVKVRKYAPEEGAGGVTVRKYTPEEQREENERAEEKQEDKKDKRESEGRGGGKGEWQACLAHGTFLCSRSRNDSRCNLI